EIGGNVLRFHSIPGIHVVDVDGRSGVSYQQCNIYRRTLILVEVGQDDGYLIDIFRVKGGTENYVLSLHGNEGTFDFAGATLSDPCTEGTWAGADVEYGELYDQPDLQPGEYGAYTGSGYQHLENWQQADPDSNSVVVGSWSYSEPNSMLRAHIVPDPCQDIIVADGRVSPTGKIDAVLKYMLTQRTPDVTVGDNFVTVLEICGADPIIDHVEFEKNAVYGEGAEQVIMLSVHRTDGVVDTIAISPDDTVAYQVNMVPKISSDAVVALVRSEETALGQKINAYGFGGTYLVSQQSSVNHSIPETMTGTIQDCDYENKTITVDGMTLPADPNELIGSMIRIYNSDHSCMYKIDDIQSAGLNADITLAGSDIYTGRIKVNSIDPDTNQVFTVTNLLHPDNMSGMYLISDDTVWSNKIASVNTSGDIYTLELVSDPCNVSPEDNAWISDVGIGSSVEIERSLSLSKMNRVHNVSRNIWYETIQDAVDMAETTDEIEVLPGTYYETVNFDGWAGTLRSIDTNNLDVINSTIIDANDVDDGVVFDSGEVSDSVLCGLTIYKGAPYGIHCYRASPTINKCIIRDNATAGLLCNGAEADISNCIITGNDAGVHLFNNSSVNLNNCTIANNAYYGIYSDGSGSPNIRNTLLWGNDDDLVTCTANYSCIEDGDAGAGNINTNPDFVDLAGADYHLKSISPCINAGDPNSKHVNTVDIDGQSRLLYGRVDIGADEVVPIAGDIEIDEDIDLGDLMIFVRNWLSICSGPDWCQNCDFDQSGKIDLYDFAFMATHWLAGTE
ncbi:MAG: right-handed parallel beta-helix repeat-containing protein, partial [Sedimentisphaerales bacterium]|nr:right-handed parallel beta-helix repeat-containing protein [Sedimentisphaerales bacterium]